jgi:hypothetical protein
VTAVKVIAAQPTMTVKRPSRIGLISRLVPQDPQTRVSAPGGKQRGGLVFNISRDAIRF